MRLAGAWKVRGDRQQADAPRVSVSLACGAGKGQEICKLLAVQ